jgi:2,3-dihydroxybenzoate decarboxylase
MQGKIGLEEHFAIPETLNDSKGYLGDNVWPELEKRLMDMQEYRLRQMDAHGMEMMILSLNAPAASRGLRRSRCRIRMRPRASSSGA